jgi:hypothetical protein
LKPPLCVISSWLIKRVYTILIFNTISRSSNLDNCFYLWLILTSISHLKSSLQLLFHLLFIILYSSPPCVWPRSCRVIYYFDTPILKIRHQSFDRVTCQRIFSSLTSTSYTTTTCIISHQQPPATLATQASNENSLKPGIPVSTSSFFFKLYYVLRGACRTSNKGGPWFQPNLYGGVGLAHTYKIGLVGPSVSPTKYG